MVFCTVGNAACHPDLNVKHQQGLLEGSDMSGLCPWTAEGSSAREDGDGSQWEKAGLDRAPCFTDKD